MRDVVRKVVTNVAAVGVSVIAGELACPFYTSVLGMGNTAFGIACPAVVRVGLEIDADAVASRQSFFAHTFCRRGVAFLGFGIADGVFAAALDVAVCFALLLEEEKAFGTGIRDTDGISALTVAPARKARTVDFVISA